MVNSISSEETVTLVTGSSVTLSENDYVSSSASSSGSDEDDSDDSTSESEDEDSSDEYMESLIQQAKNNAREKRLQEDALQVAFAADEDVIQLGGEAELSKLPGLNPGKLPLPYISSASKGAGPSKVRNPDIEAALARSAHISAPAPPEPPRPNLSKKERKSLRSKTAGPGWFDLPAPTEADLPRLYREVEALRLRNQLDPKRFYRKDAGEGKGIKGLPEHFAIGTIVETRSPFAEGPARESSTRKRTLVDELVDDAEARSYAKRKFRDLQTVRGARGRGTLAKRKQGRREKW